MNKLIQELKNKVTTHYKNYFENNTETNCYYEMITGDDNSLYSYSDLINEIEYMISERDDWENLIVTPEYHTDDSIIPMDEIINIKMAI